MKTTVRSNEMYVSITLSRKSDVDAFHFQRGNFSSIEGMQTKGAGRENSGWSGYSELTETTVMEALIKSISWILKSTKN